MSDDDTQCPECGGSISASASFCMHCYADLPDGGVEGDAPTADAGADAGGFDSTGDDDGFDSDDAGGFDSAGDDDGFDSDDAGGFDSADDGGFDSTDDGGFDSDGDSRFDDPPVTSDEASDGATGDDRPTDDPARDDDELLDPEGLVDNTLTILVAIAGGIVVGIAGTIELLVLTGSGLAVPVGLLVWLVATAHLARRYTVQGAIAHTGYAVAVVLLVVPLVAASPLIRNSSIIDRVEFFFSALVIVAFPAGLAAGIGYVASWFAPETS